LPGGFHRQILMGKRKKKQREKKTPAAFLKGVGGKGTYDETYYVSILLGERTGGGLGCPCIRSKERKHFLRRKREYESAITETPGSLFPRRKNRSDIP